MNRSIVALVTAVLLGVSVVASAQVTGGVKAGVNIANMTFEQAGNTLTPSSRTVFTGGAFAEFGVLPHVSIQPEALFTMKGAEYSLSGLPSMPVGTAKMKCTYLDVPVLVKVDVPTTGAFVPYLYAGPNFGFLLSAKVSSDMSGSLLEEDVKKDMKSTDVGIAFGGGVRFGKLLAEVRYVRGLTNVLKAGDLVAPPTFRNHGIQLMAGIRF